MVLAADTTMQPTGPAYGTDAAQSPSDKALVEKLTKIIKKDKQAHEKAFKRMKRDMHVAMHGAEDSWGEAKYRANIVGRHVKQKTAALYAKNPKATAKRRVTLDFAVWDENPDSLKLAFQSVQTAVQSTAMTAGVTEAHSATGNPVPVAPQLPPGFQQAQALIQDFQQGMQKRQLLDRTGKTLEVLFTNSLAEQKPVDFKTGMKQCVRRASTTAVGYIELGFQRQYGPRPGLTQQLTDARTRLDHLQRLTAEAADNEIGVDDAEMAELQNSITALQQEPEILLREGLIFDFPQSTKVIPDQLCRSLVGFVGARHITIEYLFTPDEVEEMFGVDLSKENGYKGYSANGQANEEASSANKVEEYSDGSASPPAKSDLVCVWKHYDKPSGLVYYIADGYCEFLRAPAEPDVFVEDFWPVYALTFNAVESEDELFPPSDVTLLLSMQREYNRSREGKRTHRKAALPRWGFTKGALDAEDIENFQASRPYDAIALNKDPQTKLADVLEVIPVPGVDPNLYDTGEIFNDIQLVGGTQEASYGGVSKATATESAIAANSSSSTDGSAVDDLDSFLTTVIRAAGQILLREMSPEKVTEIVGPGAVWPHLSLAEIADEIYLDVEAGSTGKPNQAIEINNWKEMLPFLIQLGNIQPDWLARETLRRLDDRMDLTDAIVSGLPSIVAQNQQAQPGTGNPATDPAAQGPAGRANGPQPPGQTGSGPAFGSNQV